MAAPRSEVAARSRHHASAASTSPGAPSAAEQGGWALAWTRVRWPGCATRFCGRDRRQAAHRPRNEGGAGRLPWKARASVSEMWPSRHCRRGRNRGTCAGRGDETVDRSLDVRGHGGHGGDDADEETSAVYRTWLRSVVIAVALIAFGIALKIAFLPAVILAVRAFQRAVIVSPFGLQARRTFSSWRFPWSEVESFAIGDRAWRKASLTVVLVDGSTRSARVGLGRRRKRSFAEVAAAAQRRSGRSIPWPSPSPHHRDLII